MYIKTKPPMLVVFFLYKV